MHPTNCAGVPGVHGNWVMGYEAWSCQEENRHCRSVRDCFGSRQYCMWHTGQDIRSVPVRCTLAILLWRRCESAAYSRFCRMAQRRIVLARGWIGGERGHGCVPLIAWSQVFAAYANIAHVILFQVSRTCDLSEFTASITDGQYFLVLLYQAYWPYLPLWLFLHSPHTPACGGRWIHTWHVGDCV